MQHHIKKSDQALHNNGFSQNVEQTPKGKYKLVNLTVYRNCFVKFLGSFLRVFYLKTKFFNGTDTTIVIQFLMCKRFGRCIYRYKGSHSSMSWFWKRKVVLCLKILCICSLQVCPHQLHCVSINLLVATHLFKHKYFASLLPVSMSSSHLRYFCTIGECVNK